MGEGEDAEEEDAETRRGETGEVGSEQTLNIEHRTSNIEH